MGRPLYRPPPPPSLGLGPWGLVQPTCWQVEPIIWNSCSVSPDLLDLCPMSCVWGPNGRATLSEWDPQGARKQSGSSPPAPRPWLTFARPPWLWSGLCSPLGGAPLLQIPDLPHPTLGSPPRGNVLGFRARLQPPWGAPRLTVGASPSPLYHVPAGPAVGRLCSLPGSTLTWCSEPQNRTLSQVGWAEV